MKRTILIFFLISTLYSCNTNEKKLLSENQYLKATIENLKAEIDSLNKLPSFQFEKIAIEDKILDSLRNLSLEKHITDLTYNEIKVSDTILIKQYTKFSKSNSGSLLSLFAFQRIREIREYGKAIKYNQIIGEWKLDSIKGLCFNKNYKTKMNEKIVITKDKIIEFYSNDKLIEKHKFYLAPSISFGGTVMNFYDKPTNFINLNINNYLSIGKAYSIGGGYKVYEKTN